MSLNRQRRSLLLKVMAGFTAITFSKTFATSNTSQASKTSTTVEHEIVITGFKFEPDLLKIKAGDTITWLNKDIVPHTATATDESWDTGIIEQDQRKSVTFTKESTSSYFCFYHPSMEAKLDIIVEA